MQRKNEREIRRWKREYAAMEAAGLDTSESAVRIQHWQAAQKDFLEKTGLKRQYERKNAITFGYKQASAALKQANDFYEVWSKSVGANDAIETLAKYYDVKYNDSARYALLKTYIQSVQSGRMSPMAHFDLYEEYYAIIQNEIVGKTAGGIQITRQTKHLLERVFGTMVDPEKLKKDLKVIRRSGVSIDDMKDALFSSQDILPVRSSMKNGFVRRSQKFVGKKYSVTLNPDTGVILQTIPLGG